MRLHSRTLPVQKAGNQIKMSLIEMQQEHDLTNVEMLRVLIEAQQEITKYMLRDERHPGDPEHKADEA